MKNQPENVPADQLPIKHGLSISYVLSMIIAILMTIASLGGLLFPAIIYPTDELVQSFMANDVVNLFIGVLILLVSMWLTRRDKLVGLLLWPGALFYVLYNYIGYLLGTPFSLFTFGYLALVLLSAYAVFALLKSIDGDSVQKKLSGGVPTKTAGWILAVFGVLFSLRAIATIAGAGISQTMLPMSEIGVLVADLVISIIWVTGGAMLLRRMPLGYVSGLGLLFVGSMLFIGLIMFLVLQPVLTGAAFSLVDVTVVFGMGLVCFIPFALFVRGVTSSGKSP
jgi:hypothetical protein